MTPFARRDRRFRLLQLVSILAVLIAASITVTGCSGGAESTSDGTKANSGGRSFIPEKPLMIAEANIEEKNVQTSLDTLERLPAWGFVKSQLPGKGTAKDVFRLVAKSTSLKDDKKATYADDFEPWLGDRAGVAVFGDRSYKDLKDTDKGGFFAWIDADDEAKARTFLSSLKDIKKHDVDGTEGWRYDDSTMVVYDGALLITANDDDMKRIITAHDDTKTVDGDMLRLLDRESRTEQLSLVVDADHGLKLAADAIEHQTKTVRENDLNTDSCTLPGEKPKKSELPCNDAPDDAGDGASTTMTTEQGKRLATMLRSDAITDLLPDVVGASTGIDDKGIWMDFTWSNAGKQTDAFNARDLAGSMPESVMSASAGVSDGTFAKRVPKLWKEIEKAGDFQLSDLAKQCPAEQKALCSALIDYATPMLTTDLLEQQTKKSGAVGIAAGIMLNVKMPLAGAAGPAEGASSGSTADVSRGGGSTGIPPITPVKNGPKTSDPKARSGGNSGIAGPSTPGASAVPPFNLEIGVYETAEHPDAFADTVVENLDLIKPLATAIGINLVAGKTGGNPSLKVQVARLSPLGKSLRAVTPSGVKGLGAVGISRDMLIGAGQTFTAHKAGDGWLVALPDSSSDVFTKALSGEDQLADNADFKRDLKAAGVPKETTMLQWQDLGGLIDQLLQLSPETARISGLVSNNLDHVGGIVTFTTREGDGDDRIGVATVSIPLFE